MVLANVAALLCRAAAARESRWLLRTAVCLRCGLCAQVMQVRKKDTGRVYAMKVLQKANIIRRNQVRLLLLLLLPPRGLHTSHGVWWFAGRAHHYRAQRTWPSGTSVHCQLEFRVSGVLLCRLCAPGTVRLDESLPHRACRRTTNCTSCWITALAVSCSSTWARRASFPRAVPGSMLRRCGCVCVCNLPCSAQPVLTLHRRRSRLRLSTCTNTTSCIVI